MLKVLMVGCNGKMGQMITQILNDDKEMKIMAGVDCFTETTNPYPVFSKIEDCKVEVDVVIEFSVVEAIDSLLEYCIQKKLPLVICTTGLSGEQQKAIEKAAKEIPILKSANMSLGINLLLKLVQDVAKLLAPAGYDMEIVERHHKQKVDAPSGTALALADAINAVLAEEYAYTYDRSKRREKRGEKEIGLSAVRGGTIVGEHDVIYAGVDEVIELKHVAYSRSVFGKGAIEAARFLAKQKAGLYSMSDVIRSH